MRNSESTPWWVFLAFSSVETRRGAFLLVLFNVILSVYCLPWNKFFVEPAWVGKVFIVDDWSWFIMMLAMTAWYAGAFLWADRNFLWNETETVEVVEDVVERV